MSKPFNNHSPLPWRECICELEDANGKNIASSDYDQNYAYFPQEDLDFILHAVNTYYEREEAFKALIKELYFATQVYEIIFYVKSHASGEQGSITIGPNNTNTLRLAIEKAEKALEPKTPSVPAREENI